MNTKKDRLHEIIMATGRAAVAFSGGADSTYLLSVAHEVLGDEVMAVTAVTDLHPSGEAESAKAFTAERNIRHEIVTAYILEREDVAANPPDRCYLCKREIFSLIKAVAEPEGYLVMEGTNADDAGTYRPGMNALAEMGIASPLRDAGLTKDEIRHLSRERGLSTWDRPAEPCLATRVPYGASLTREKLAMIEESEGLLRDLGFRTVRVRHHGDVARIEVPVDRIGELLEEDTRPRVISGIRKAGFTHVAIELQGFRSGSMDETIKDGTADG